MVLSTKAYFMIVWMQKVERVLVELRLLPTVAQCKVLRTDLSLSYRILTGPSVYTPPIFKIWLFFLVLLHYVNNLKYFASRFSSNNRVIDESILLSENDKQAGIRSVVVDILGKFFAKETMRYPSQKLYHGLTLYYVINSQQIHQQTRYALSFLLPKLI